VATRWEYGSLITVALSPAAGHAPEHLAGILVTALQARVVSVVELGELVPGERFTAMNAVGEDGWIITGPATWTDFSGGTAVMLDHLRLEPWIGQLLANSPGGPWTRGYYEYPMRRVLG
jgi:hypothetical protein